MKYANRSDLPTLAEKLEFLFKNKLTPLATKNKSKSLEEDVIIYHSNNNLIIIIETIQDS